MITIESAMADQPFVILTVEDAINRRDAGAISHPQQEHEQVANVQRGTVFLLLPLASEAQLIKA